MGTIKRWLTIIIFLGEQTASRGNKHAFAVAISRMEKKAKCQPFSLGIRKLVSNFQKPNVDGGEDLNMRYISL